MCGGTLVPRKWQLLALGNWQRELRGVVSVVTGGGKTIFALLCICEFLQRYPEGRVSIVVPTVALLDQWFDAMVNVLGLRPEELSVYGGGERSEREHRVSLFVVNTGRTMARQLDSECPRMLIVDECHRVGSKENARVLQGNFVATLGLSATPVRQYDDGFERYIEPALGPIIFEYGYAEALEDGVIAPFELAHVRVAFLPDEEAAYDSATRALVKTYKLWEQGKASWERVKRLMLRRASIASGARMRTPVAGALVEAHRGDRTVVFFESIAAANQLHTLLQARGWNAALYHSKMGPDYRRDNLRLFRKGMVDVLVTCRALDEGADIPEATVGIVASSSASIRQRIQRMGRVLRRHPSKDTAIVYTLYVTDSEAARLQQESGRLTAVARVRWLEGRLT